MAKNPLARLPDLGQSVWYDFIRRDLISSGSLKRLIEQDGLGGMTSNPTIFAQAIEGSELYDEDIRASADDSAADVFERIAVAEIRSAADCFRPVYERTKRRDGYVSIEVSPTLARDTAGTLDAARRLWSACDRENVMIKIPGTAEGLPAVSACLAEGINVNITLLFSVTRYRQVLDSWLSALEARVAKGLPIDAVASVASFFVSRVDSLLDKAMAGRPALAPYTSRLGIANARLAYQAYENVIVGSPRFAALRSLGAMTQRPLWASTSTKDPALPDVYYVEALIGVDTVNTVPPATYDAYRKHGEPQVRIEDDLDEASAAFAALKAAGIDFEGLMTQLEQEGVKKFADSYRDLLKSIGSKRETIGS